MKLDKEEDIEDDDDFADVDDDLGADSQLDDYDDFGFNDVGDRETPMEKHRDLLLQLTDFDPHLKEMVNGWLGLVFSEKEQKYIQVNKPIMNHNCAAWCITNLRVYAKRTNLITNLNPDSYKWIVGDAIEVIWLGISCNAEEFGIEKNTDIFRICNEIEHSVVLVLIGAGNGKYNELLSTTTMRSEHITQQQQPYYNMQPSMMPGQNQQPKKPGIFQRIGNAIKQGDS